TATCWFCTSFLTVQSCSLVSTYLPPTYLLFSLNAPPPTEIYTLSLHDALPISARDGSLANSNANAKPGNTNTGSNKPGFRVGVRSEEHTSELQSLRHLVCRLLLEKKKKNTKVLTVDLIIS